MSKHQDTARSDSDFSAGRRLGPHLPFGAEVEQRLRWAQKMEAMGQLSGRLAHEINNQITMVVGRTALLLNRDETPADVRAELADVLAAAERAGDLVRQWLTLGRKEAPRRGRLDLNALIAGMLPMLRASLGRGVDLAAHCLAANEVLADRSEIELVLLNLVLNARDAVGGRGKIALGTADVRLRDNEAGCLMPVVPGPYVALTVRDNGCGMDQATREQIFEPYFTTKGPGRGTGLGLCNVWAVVQGHGGNLQVTSAPGLGSTFTVYFPLATEDQEAALPAAPTPSGADTILVVGQQDIVPGVIREILTRSGYNVLEARHSAEALRLWAVRPQPVSLVIIDSENPTESSALLHRLTELRPETKVLFTSGCGLREWPIHLPAGTAWAFLPKPFTTQALLSKVAELLDMSRQHTMPAAG